jgi:hypothetical protein
VSLQQPIEEFIRRYIDSIEALEILMLLQRAPDTFWTPVAIESHLGMKQGIAEQRLQRLLQNGFVTKGMSGGYRYAPADDDLRAGISALAAAYADGRSAVLNVVFSESHPRLRAFSDAFKVKSE